MPNLKDLAYLLLFIKGEEYPESLGNY